MIMKFSILRRNQRSKPSIKMALLTRVLFAAAITLCVIGTIVVERPSIQTIDGRLKLVFGSVADEEPKPKTTQPHITQTPDIKADDPNVPNSDGVHNIAPAADAKPGDVIEEAPLKGVKKIYAGTLVFSPTTLTLNEGDWFEITVKTADGRAIQAPAMPWDYRGGISVGADNNSPGATNSTWTLMVQNYAEQSGTYTIRLVSYDDNPGDVNSYEYSGTFTVVVP